jgi:hypothetical protein
MRQEEAAEEARSPWIESAAWDLGWIHCGFWLAALHALLLKRATGFAAWYAFAFLAFWMSHRAGTVFISFGLREYRALLAAQRARFLDLPAAWFLLAFAVLFAPPAWLPLSPTDRLGALILIRFGCDALHFGGQHYGVLSLYRLRARQDPRSPFKAAEKAFCFAAALVSMVAPAVLRLALPALSPAFSPEGAARLWVGAAFVAFAAFVAAAEASAPRPSAPKLLYVLYLAGAAVAALSARSLAQAGLVVALQHYVVATGLATRMIANAAPAPGRPPRPRKSPAAAFALLFVLGLLPAVWGWRSGQAVPLDWLLGRWRSAADGGLVFKLSAALAYGLSYAHNAWDAAVFRLQDPAVRAVTLPLILGPESERKALTPGAARAKLASTRA